MILPIELFTKDRTAPPEERKAVNAAIEAHDDKVLEVCKQAASEILPMFGEGRRMTSAGLIERATLGYARPLALVLRHVDFLKDEDRAKRVKKALLRGAADLSTKDSAFTPPALELVVASSYCLAYPGGVDLFAELPDIYARPSRRGDAAGFTRIVENMDMYWNDALEGLRRAELLGAFENGTASVQPSDAVLAELRLDVKDPSMSHYRRVLSKLGLEWRREEGDKSPKWERICRYWTEARGAVQIPEIKEGTWTTT